MAGDLNGRVALVTGASRGIGAATALALGAAGVHVILTGRTDGALEEVESAIHAAGGSATIAPLDLADSEAIDRLGHALGGRWPQLDILVLNAAMLGDLSPLVHMPPAQFERILALNVTSQWRLLRAVDPMLRAATAGRVIALTTSVAAAPRAYWGPYAASKAALEVLIDTYALEVANLSPVRTAIVDPGRTRTAMRASAYPGENPDTLKPASAVGDAIRDLLLRDFDSRVRLTL